MVKVTILLCLTENKFTKFYFVSFFSISLQTVTTVLLLFACSPPRLQHSLSEFCQRITTTHSVWGWTSLVVEIVSVSYFTRLRVIFINYFTRQTCNNCLICYWAPAHFEVYSSGSNLPIKVAFVDSFSHFQNIAWIHNADVSNMTSLRIAQRNA